MEIELEVPEEVVELFDEFIACKECRDECIRSIFKAKRAIYYGKKAVRARRDAWRLIRETWPEHDFTGNWSYDQASGTVCLKVQNACGQVRSAAGRTSPAPDCSAAADGGKE